MIEILKNDAIMGAIAGSCISILLATAIERRKQTLAAKRSIIADLAIIGHDYLATLKELLASQEINDSRSIKSLIAQATRLDGNLIAIQTRLWYLFKQRKVRAAMSRFLNRCINVRKYLQEPTIDKENGSKAISWLESGLEELELQTALASKLKLKDQSRYYFVGFRKVTYEDKRLLSFEDEPPPWKFAVSFNLLRNPKPDDYRQIESNLCKKIGQLKCKVHSQPAHIIFNGRDIKNFDLLFHVCCEEFGSIVKNKIAHGLEQSGKLSGKIIRDNMKT